jgi:hypothetical protein
MQRNAQMKRAKPDNKPCLRYLSKSNMTDTNTDTYENANIERILLKEVVVKECLCAADAVQAGSWSQPQSLGRKIHHAHGGDNKTDDEDSPVQSD